MASTPNETSLDMNAFNSFITAINERNPGISSLIWGWGTSTPSEGLPIYIKMERPSPPNSPLNLGKTILSLTFQAILASFISSPTSPPPLPTILFTAAMLMSFAVSFAGLNLPNAFPRIALLLEKFGALLAAIGICIVPSLLVHPTWICWLALGSILLPFLISLK